MQRRCSVVLVGIQIREQHFRETELAEVADAHRIQDALQVIALMLHHAGMEAVDGAVNLVALQVQALIAQRLQRGTTPRMPGTDRQPSQPSSSSSDKGVSTGLMSTVSGTAGASG